ncbi:MAG: hypothetical protein HC844_20980 [Tabrizicola sp.]|nr:hypothetical protein [Tabrizicola sp.]
MTLARQTKRTLFEGSLRRRLVVQLLLVAAGLAVALALTVRITANQAAEATQDAILGAATTSIAEQLRGTDQGVDLDLAYSTFSMLGAIGEDRLFYRILIGNETVTGYDDLPLPDRHLRRWNRCSIPAPIAAM